MKKPKSTNKIAYIIGFRWNSGDIGGYTVHNMTIFNGDIEDAKRTLAYVQKQDPEREHKYEIFKLV